VRRLRTQVILYLEDARLGRCRVRLVNHGYGEGEERDLVFTYFERAWGLVMTDVAEPLVRT
jgi:hypothetical protein